MKTTAQAGAGKPASRRALVKLLGTVARAAGSFALAVGLVAAPIGATAAASAAPLQHGTHERGGHRAFGPGRGHGRHEREPVTGTVTSVGSGTFSLVTKGGAAFSVVVSAGTTYSEPGVPSGTTVGFGSILTGDLVQVSGPEPSAGTIDATSVRIPEAHLTGTVSSVTGSEIVLTSVRTALTSTSTTVDVETSSTTVFRDPGVPDPSIANVLAGDFVAVTGLQAGAAAGALSVDATLVDVPLASYVGTVGNLSASGFTLTSTSSTVTVTVEVTSSTHFVVAGVGTTTVSRLANGDVARVVGNQEGTDTVSALLVQALAPRHFPGRGRHRGPGFGFGPGAGFGPGGASGFGDSPGGLDRHAGHGSHPDGPRSRGSHDRGR